MWGRDPQPRDAVSKTDYMVLTSTEYAFNSGIWRIMEILDRHEAKATCFIGGLAAEKAPEIVKELSQRGHEIAAHSYDQSEPLFMMTREKEKEVIRKSVIALENASGQRPVGWISPGTRPTENTLELLVEEGFVWHGDFFDSDFPYKMKVKDRVLIEVPYKVPGHTDYDIFGIYGAMKTPTDAFQFLKDEFDAVYEESHRRSMRMSYCVHPYVSGTPGRAAALENFIKYAKGHPNVWFARCIDIANCVLGK
jgi:peptidoglycan/xylan/chitin deacetylase (PgdA/CDA1 family)